VLYYLDTVVVISAVEGVPADQLATFPDITIEVLP